MQSGDQGRVRIALRAVAALVALGACGSPVSGTDTPTTSSPIETTTTSLPVDVASTLESTDSSVVHAPRSIGDTVDTEFPHHAVDPSAMWVPPEVLITSDNLSVVAHGEAAAAALPNPVVSGFRLEVSTCVTVAPYVWVIEGTISADDPLPERVVLTSAQSSGDVTITRPVLVRIVGEGAFRLVLDGRLVEQPISYFSRSECRIRVEGYGALAVSVVDPIDPAEGVVWEAPAGTVHELGMEARLTSEPAGPGIGWTYLNWAKPPLPFRTILAAIPERGVVHVLGVSGSIDPARACRTVVTAVLIVETEHQATIVQWRDCPERDRIGPFDREPVDGYPHVRFTDYGPGTQETAHGSVANTLFKIEAPDRETIVAVLNQLELRTNLTVSALADSPYRADDLDDAIASAFLEDGATEIARAEFEWGWLVVAHGVYVDFVGAEGEERVEESVIVEYAVTRTENDGWIVSDGGGGSWTGCLHVTGGANQQRWTEVVIMSDASWTLERLVDGEWIRLDASGGAYLNSGVFSSTNTIENWDGALDFRVRDADGNEPACVADQ